MCQLLEGCSSLTGTWRTFLNDTAYAGDGQTCLKLVIDYGVHNVAKKCWNANRVLPINIYLINKLPNTSSATPLATISVFHNSLRVAVIYTKLWIGNPGTLNTTLPNIVQD